MTCQVRLLSSALGGAGAGAAVCACAIPAAVTATASAPRRAPVPSTRFVHDTESLTTESSPDRVLDGKGPKSSHSRIPDLRRERSAADQWLPRKTAHRHSVGSCAGHRSLFLCCLETGTVFYTQREKRKAVP